MVIGALGAIRVISEKGNIRSFVAYTSINQIGFVLLGLTVLNPSGFVSSLIYLVVYLLSSILFLGTLARLRYLDGSTGKWRNFESLNQFHEIYNGNLS